MSLPLLLLLNLVLASMLCGLIWLVQLVHYPGFFQIGVKESIVYQKHHTSSISWIVIPLMLAELGLAIWLLFFATAVDFFSFLIYGATLCVVAIWLVTFGVAVPLHNKLSSYGYNKEMIRKLVNVNWIRTVCWSLRMLLLFLTMMELL